MNKLENKIILAQTDTTVGFLSKDFRLLNKIKNRKLDTPCILSTAFLSELKSFTRCPVKFRNMIRKSKKTSFVLANSFSFRFVNDERHSKFLKKFGFFYSSSANKHGQNFDELWAKKVADIVLDEPLYEAKSSSMIRLFRTKKTRLRR